jgi:hypothetical protein
MELNWFPIVEHAPEPSASDAAPTPLTKPAEIAVSEGMASQPAIPDPAGSEQEPNTMLKFIQNFETVASRLEADIEKALGKAPKLEQVLQAGLTYVGPILQTAVTLEAGGPAGAAVASGLGMAQAELTAAKQLTLKAGTSGSIKSILAGVAGTLPTLVKEAGAGDASVAAVTSVVTELNALAAAIPAPAAADAAPVAPAAAA